MTIRPALAPVLATALTLGLLCAAPRAAAATPIAFTARYDVLQGGAPMGEASVTLRPAGGGEWIYRTEIKGTGGLAALLGASTTETSRFRWKGDVPEAISYDYQLIAAGKHKQRHLTVDWNGNQVTVDEGKGPQTFAARPGMVERNTAPLAIGIALDEGRKNIALPIAGRHDVQLQHFGITGRESVDVPAGRFHAIRVDRTGAALGFSAWYAPGRYPIPVKLSQHDGGNLTMELVSFSSK